MILSGRLEIIRESPHKQCMNFNKPQRPGREAKLRYLDADFQVVTHGDFVKCAKTGKIIPLDELKYWSVERQEPYYDAQVSAASFAKDYE